MNTDEILKKLESFKSYSIICFKHNHIEGYSWTFEQTIDGVDIKIRKTADTCLEALIAVWDEIAKLSKGNKNLKPLMIEGQANEARQYQTIKQDYDANGNVLHTSTDAVYYSVNTDGLG